MLNQELSTSSNDLRILKKYDSLKSKAYVLPKPVIQQEKDLDLEKD